MKKTIVQLFSGLFRLCACLDPDCRALIPIFDKQERPRIYKKGHQSMGKHLGKNGNGRYLQGKYWKLHRPSYFSSDSKGSVMEHIYIYQEHYKCCILPWCDIHHIDGHPEREDGNRLENLQLMTGTEHMRLHHIGNKKGIIDMSRRICLLCGSDRTYIQKGNGRPQWVTYKDGVICKKCHYRLPETREYYKLKAKEYYKKKEKD